MGGVGGAHAYSCSTTVAPTSKYSGTAAPPRSGSRTVRTVQTVACLASLKKTGRWWGTMFFQDIPRTRVLTSFTK